MQTRMWSVVFVTVVVLGCAQEHDARDLYYPQPGDWDTRAPEEMGMDAARLQVAVDYAQAHLTTQISEDPGLYLTERFEGIPHQEIVGPTAQRGGVNGIVLKGGFLVAEWETQIARI